MQFNTNPNPSGPWTIPNTGGNWTIPNAVHPVLQPQQITVPTPAQPQSSLIWVEGEQGANNYPVARGNTILLLDSTATLFYLKSVDLTGAVNLRTFEFTERIPVEAPKEEIKTAEPKEEVDIMKKLDNSLDSINKKFEDLEKYLSNKFEHDGRFMLDLEDKINRIDQRTQWKNKTKKEGKVDE